MFKFTLIALLVATAVTALPSKRQSEYRTTTARVAVPAGNVAPKRPDGRIVGGELASQGQFPHQAALSIDGGSFCGGVLLSTEWVMTAGHCTDRASTIEVTMGDQQLSDVTGSEQVRNSASIYTHEDFGVDGVKNDIGLIQVDSPFELNENVAVIEVATSGADVGEEVILSGWGKDSDDSEGVSDLLRFVNVPIAEFSRCKDYFYDWKFDGAIQICVDTEGDKGACNGDSGGPMIPLDGSVVYGVTSFGPSVGCEKGLPNVYTRVSAYASWISGIMG